MVYSYLKLIEGTEAQIQVSNGYGIRSYTFNTRNVLFICGGAFAGLLDEKRKGQKNIGFSTKTETISAEDMNVTTEDLKKYGIIPELLGRLPVIITLDELTEDELVRVLTEPEDAITKEYEALMESDGIELTFTNAALQEVAKEAIRRKTGARGLRAILEDSLLNLMYEAPSLPELDAYEITEEDIRTKCGEIRVPQGMDWQKPVIRKIVASQEK